MPSTTRSKPGVNRNRPADFREQFVRLGWDVVEHYSTGWKTVGRWIAEEGHNALMADRRAYRQLERLKERVVVIVQDRSPIVAADFLAEVSRRAAAGAVASLRKNQMLRG